MLRDVAKCRMFSSILYMLLYSTPPQNFLPEQRMPHTTFREAKDIYKWADSLQAKKSLGLKDIGLGKCLFSDPTNLKVVDPVLYVV